MVNMEEYIGKEVKEAFYVHPNIIYLQDCCKKYGIKNGEDYKALKKFVRICNDLINSQIIGFAEVSK